MTSLRPPPTGLALWALVHPYRTQLRARQPIAATLVDVDTDALIVQVGAGAPYRLLVVCASECGLLDVRLWEVRKRLIELHSERVMSDLVGAVLVKVAGRYGLGE